MTETATQTSSKTSSKQNLIGYFIFLQAFVATLGSLYYSTFGEPFANLRAGSAFPWGHGFTPCMLCWFGRILMYPLTLISLVGLLKEDKKFTDYVLPLSVPGIALALYHYTLQRIQFHNPFGCTLENPCNALQVEYLGFITIPFLELTAFIVITVLSVWYRRLNQKKPSLD